jgi:Uma2 family endonuclease
MTTAALMTADEYIATADDRPRWSELVNGEVYIMNTPAVRHQEIVAFLQVEIALWVRGGPNRGRSPAPVDCRLDNGTVLAPDVMWLGEGRVASFAVTHLVGPPDLAVEVRSPSTWGRDVGVKRLAYERNGLPELWLVDTASNTVLVYRRSAPELAAFDVDFELESGAALTTPLMPGLSIDVAELFNR